MKLAINNGKNKKPYTIKQYVIGIHEMYTALRVKAASGKVVEVYKMDNNVQENVFWIDQEIKRKSKKSVINYLQKN